MGVSVGAAVVVVGIMASMLLGGSDDRLVEAREECRDEDLVWSYLYSTIDDDGRSLYLDGRGEDSQGVSVDYQLCILRDLDVPSSVLTRMSNTTALMGMQAGSWDGISASWTYHPRNGLDIILELE